MTLATLVVTLAVTDGCRQHDHVAEHAALVKRGSEIFDARCSPCHGPRADWPIAKRLKGRTAGQFHALFDHLPSVNPIMPPFDAPDADHRAVAAYLASLSPPSRESRDEGWDGRSKLESPGRSGGGS